MEAERRELQADFDFKWRQVASNSLYLAIGVFSRQLKAVRVGSPEDNVLQLGEWRFTDKKNKSSRITFAMMRKIQHAHTWHWQCSRKDNRQNAAHILCTASGVSGCFYFNRNQL